MKRLLLTIVATGCATPVAAQPLPTDAAELIVTAPRSDKRVASPVLTIDGAAIDDRTPVAVADLFRTLPGMNVRVNSRGETVVRIRGSEERQTGIFLDGAPLATPWDGRVDLALLPAGLISRIDIVKGAVPLEYGPNMVGGVVDLQTGTAAERVSLRAEGRIGTYGLLGASAVVSAPMGSGFSLLAAGTQFERDAERIADRRAVPFDPSPNGRRTNTDVDGRSVYAALGYDNGKGLAFRASWLRGDVERGIAAQGDLDPAVASPRFWRYPRWRLDQLSLSGDIGISDTLGLRFTGWQQWFEQTILSYTNVSYSTLRAREAGKDATLGARATLTADWDSTAVRFSATAQSSTHRQQDATSTNGLESGFANGPLLRYRQGLYSLGGEVDQRLAPGLTVTLGTGRDWARYPLTGDKPAQPHIQATNLYAAARWNPTEALTATASIGRRARFPAMRELFGEALGRFLLNPDLGPERSWLGDLALRWSPSDALNVEGGAWIADNEGTISQRVVRVGNVNRRQRYNMAGSVAHGLEASATIRATATLSAELGAAFQWGKARREADGSRPVLLQRPASQFSAAVDWRPVARLDLRAEVMRIAGAFDLADDSSVRSTPASTVVGLRAFLDLFETPVAGPVSLFAGADNLTDKLVLSQLGLPAPGRTVFIGIRLGRRD